MKKQYKQFNLKSVRNKNNNETEYFINEVKVSEREFEKHRDRDQGYAVVSCTGKHQGNTFTTKIISIFIGKDNHSRG